MTLLERLSFWKREKKDDEETDDDDDDYDWGLDEDREDEDWKQTIQSLLWPLRSALMVRILDEGIPPEQRGMFYFLMVQFHEDLDPPLYVYSALPAFLMRWYPWIRTNTVYTITRGIDTWRRSSYRSAKRVVYPIIYFSVYNVLINIFVDFRGLSEELEPVFGPASAWPAALLVPIIPGMFLRAVNERPNSINGFIPEGKQGIFMAIFVKASTSVLPMLVQYPLWTLYTAPSPDYPVMLLDWLVCTISWNMTLTPPLVGYAVWLLVNQFRHTRHWFNNFGGGPSVVLMRERRGTYWYIATIIVINLIQIAAGPEILEHEWLVLYPRDWIPLAIVAVVGLYLLKYGVLLRVYKYEHKPLAHRENVRLLRLRAQPLLANAPVQCDMIHTSLQRPPQYTAISHRWDAIGAPREMILIDGGLFAVSKSIFTLLMAKRSKFHPHYFWIDSICINQSDVEEKGKQVGMMRNIFEEAERAMCWIGESSGAKKAFGLIRKLSETTEQAEFDALCSQTSIGWDELRVFMSSDWFERVWIIQELAASREQVVRYGDEEIEWELLASALARIVLWGSWSNEMLCDLMSKPEVLNALVMEEVRTYTSRYEFFKLRDTLKLALRFKSTLAVDKIYALLGLVDERHTPLFHPHFGRASKAGKLHDPRDALKDGLHAMRLLSDIIGTASGTKNSRRGRAILSSGTNNALRYTVTLTRDFGNMLDRYQELKDGKAVFRDDDLQPDYSANVSASKVYTYMARDLVRQQDGITLIPLAGLSTQDSKSNSKVTDLPSWVPDWSTEVALYIFPRRRRPIAASDQPLVANTDQVTPLDTSHSVVSEPQLLETKANTLDNLSRESGKREHDALTEEATSKPKDEQPQKKPASVFKEMFKKPAGKSSFRDGGMETIHVKATILGKIEHMVQLTPECSLAKGDNGSIIADFERLRANFKKAYNLGSQHWIRPEESSDFDATFREILWAGTKSTDPQVTQESTGIESGAPAAASITDIALSHIENGTDAPLSDLDEGFCSMYRQVRTASCSTNAKLAHLIQADIIPSTRQLKIFPSKESDGKGESQWRSIMNPLRSSPLRGYARFVDYTLRRAFIVTDTGHMGLVPMTAQPGDVVVRVDEERRIVDLVLREAEYVAPQRESGSKQESPGNEDSPGHGHEAGKESQVGKQDDTTKAVGTEEQEDMGEQESGIGPTTTIKEPSYTNDCRLVGEAYVGKPVTGDPDGSEPLWFTVW